MKLAELMQPWVRGDIPECEILGLHNDSRQIKPGFLFLPTLVWLRMDAFLFHKQSTLEQLH